jgi:arylsulfatase A-like enzyme
VSRGEEEQKEKGKERKKKKEILRKKSSPRKSSPFALIIFSKRSPLINTFLFQNFKHIPNKERQMYAAMVSSLDDSIGRLTQALKKKKIYDNTIIVFATDNGGAPNGMER